MQIHPRCLDCKNFINDRKFTCKAFIEGIPDDILLGKKEHDKILKGQTGEYVLEMKKEDWKEGGR